MEAREDGGPVLRFAQRYQPQRPLRRVRTLGPLDYLGRAAWFGG